MNRIIVFAAILFISTQSFATTLSPPDVIELPIIGTEVIGPGGATLTVPAGATAVALNITVVNPTSSGFITVWPCGVERPTTSNLNYVAGDVIPNGVIAPIGGNGAVCLFSLQPTELVVDVSGWFEGASFVGATPQRLIDTRESSPVNSSAPLQVQTTNIAATTASGIATTVPGSSNAVALNITVVNPVSSGFLTVYPCDVPRPLSSNVNYTAGQIVANGVIAPVSASGTVCIFSPVETDVIVDLAGWFPGSAFTSATPKRIVDTRDGTGGLTGRLSSASPLIIPIHNINLTVSGLDQTIPTTATAAALNVTVVNPQGPGFATVWPCDASRPNASNLNFIANDVVANNVIAPISNDGTICLFSSTDADFVVDISGYFAGDVNNEFVGSTPKRFVDTRVSIGPEPGAVPLTAAQTFVADISTPIVQSNCINCHVAGGEAAGTSLIFSGSAVTNHEDINLQVFGDFLQSSESQATRILDKVSGNVTHSGGIQLAINSVEFNDLSDFLELLDQGIDRSGSGTSLAGTVAAGAALIGQVTVKGALGNTISALIEADGSYDVDVSGLTAPYRLRAEGTVGGRLIRIHSYAEAADVGGTVNITPFTDLIVANAAQQIAAEFFDSSTTVALDPVELEAQEAALQEKLQDIFTALGVSTAIDLLHSTFSADHSGLDAVLDIIRVEVDTASNIATITNLVENTEIFDNLIDPDDNNTQLVVGDVSTLLATTSDIQQIVAIFDALTAAFANGLPTQTAIQHYFSVDFYEEDSPRGLFLTDITTDPTLVGLSFNSIALDVDAASGTAEVVFNVAINGIVDVEPVMWFAAKDAEGQWQLRGDQRIVETEFSFHCNDFDGTDSFTGGCGVNTRFFDNDFTNNGTGNVPIASGTVSLIDGSNNALVKAVIFLGTPQNASAGDVQVYNEATGNFNGDFKGFGTALGEIDPGLFSVGDIIQFDLYTEALDISVSNAPQIAVGTPVATYTQTLLFAPATVGKFPSATPQTIAAISAFELGDNLTIAWALAEGTQNSEILMEVSDTMGNRTDVFLETFGSIDTVAAFASSQFDASGLDPDATSYELLVRVFASDVLTGQFHSTDYRATIPGPAATVATLPCNTESGFDESADGGLGAPINPHSFDDYLEVIASCGGAMTLDYTDFAGNSFFSDDETLNLDAIGFKPTSGSRGTGNFEDFDGIFEIYWYMESLNGIDFLVLEDSMDPALATFRETTALISVSGTPGQTGSVYTFKDYSEQTNYSTDNLTRATGSDGEIWENVQTQL